ncbi:MAG: polysaccharide biosynthesis tyrosine autokinase [Phycisphaerae bacterium]|nr:polysaccharide biosynthesis tyrosine autokinase [Phycisphaerae bacterium]
MPAPFEPNDRATGGSAGAIVPGTLAGSSPFDLPAFQSAPASLGATTTSSQQQSGFSIWHLLRYKWTILGVCLPVAAVSAAATWLLIVPQYKASAEIRVRPIIPRLVFKTEDNGLIPLYQSYLNTQVSVIRSPTVFQRVLEQPEVQGTAWYKQPQPTIGPQLTTMERLRNGLSVKPRARTEVIDVSMTADRANDAAVIVNAVLDEYVKYVRETAEQDDDLLYRKLTEEHNTLRDQIEGRERIVERLRKELGTSEPEKLVSQKRMRLDEIEAQIKVLDREMGTLRWQEGQLEAAMKEQASSSTTQAATQPANSTHFESDPEWRRLAAAIKSAEHQVKVSSDRLGSAHPRMIELTRNVELAKELLAEREAQLRAQAETQGGWTVPVAGGERSIAQELEAVRRRIGALQHDYDLVQRDLKLERENFTKTFETTQVFAKETEDIQHRQGLYETVRDRLAQKQMERNVPGSITILATAFPPSEPYNDRRVLLTIGSVFLGLCAGLGLALIRTTTSQSIHELQDVPRTVSAPFLGQLPLIRDRQLEDPEELVVQGEYLRMARTALLQRLDGKHGNTILVTSSDPGSGKTTVSTLLAESLAQCGKKVLLVDADLRKPSVSERLGIRLSPGLIETLKGEISDAEAIVRTDTERLSVIPAGQGWHGNEPELLANGALATCLERWRKDYDIVLLDSSPVLPVADARILARHTDGTIMVVREGHCRRADVVDALAHLVTAGARLMGTIFIGSLRRGGYKSSYYHYPYESPASGD